MPKTLMIKRQREGEDFGQMAYNVTQRNRAGQHDLGKTWHSNGINSPETLQRSDVESVSSTCFKSVRFSSKQPDTFRNLDNKSKPPNKTNSNTSPSKFVFRSIENIPKLFASENVLNSHNRILGCKFGDFVVLRKSEIDENISERYKLIASGKQCDSHQCGTPLSRPKDPVEPIDHRLRNEQEAPLELVKEKSLPVDHWKRDAGLLTQMDGVYQSDILGSTHKQAVQSTVIVQSSKLMRNDSTSRSSVNVKKCRAQLKWMENFYEDKENSPTQMTQRKKSQKKSPSSDSKNIAESTKKVCEEFQLGIVQEESAQIKKVLFPVRCIGQTSEPISDFHGTGNETSFQVSAKLGDIATVQCGRIGKVGLEPVSCRLGDIATVQCGRIGKVGLDPVSCRLGSTTADPVNASVEKCDKPLRSTSVSDDHWTVPSRCQTKHIIAEQRDAKNNAKVDDNFEGTQKMDFRVNKNYEDSWSYRNLSSEQMKKEANDPTGYYSYEVETSQEHHCSPGYSEGAQDESDFRYHPHLDVPPPTVQVDVVGSDDEHHVDGCSYKDDRGDTEDSGVVLDLSRSREVNASSPHHEQCWAKPLLTSTPLWRPWSQREITQPTSFINSFNCEYDTSVNRNNVMVNFKSEQRQWHTSTSSLERPLDLRVLHSYPSYVIRQNYSGAQSPVQLSLQNNAAYHQYQVMAPSQAAERDALYVPPPYQCQVPQVTTTTCAIKSETKRSPSERCTTVPAKQARMADSRQEIRKTPLAERLQAKIEQTQNIHGVLLGVPPEDALPIRVAMKGKRRVSKEDQPTQKSFKASESSKKRDRPAPYGDHELHEFNVQFYDTPLKAIYCDENEKYQVPRVPDNREDQAKLRADLLELFKHSSLPSVPSALQYNVHALCFYPKMHHLFSLHKDGVDLEVLHFGAYGQAFANLRLAALSDDDLNTVLDRMSYVGADGLMHCLVRRAIDNGAVCGHIATELGKMRRHSKNHFPEKKWVCCFCRAQMPDMTDMERHTSTHTGLKPFRCIECNKFFSQKVTLAHHMKSVHNLELEKMDPKKTFTCRQDGCLFLEHEREACLLHLEQHHNSEDFKNRKKRSQWPYDL